MQINAIRYGYSINHNVHIVMPDGVLLTASLYLPKILPTGKPEKSGQDNTAVFDAGPEKLPTVLVRLPYDRLKYPQGLEAADFFVRQGYAVMVQDLRGTFASSGQFLPYENATRDGATTIDWIASQRWSNGKVGTFGCSALGETQYSLARANHPSHAAMIASGAGGGAGSVAGRYAFFGLFEGGIFQLASGFGWFYENGAKAPNAVPAKKIDYAAMVGRLPLFSLVSSLRTEPNGFSEYVSIPLKDPRWSRLDFVSTDDRLTVPTLAINTWGDQTVADAIALSEFIRSKLPPDAAKNQHMIIAPGNHCEHEKSSLTHFGVLTVENTTQPYEQWYLAWFDYWLRGRGEGLKELPAYLYYVVGENRWLRADKWPPSGVEVQRWHLESEGSANTKYGDGNLRRNFTINSATLGRRVAFDSFRYDPMDPVPSVGGPLCCTGNLEDRGGPQDQAKVEQRRDVLIYTSEPLVAPIRLVGSPRALLHVSSTALDTDFIARLVDVWPDGRATNIQEGALRMRYRNGIDKPSLLDPGVPTLANIDMRAIAYYLPQGHRLRLHVSSSSFPRLERNLNTGGNNFDELTGVPATNRVYHQDNLKSYVELPVLKTASPIGG